MKSFNTVLATMALASGILAALAEITVAPTPTQPFTRVVRANPAPAPDNIIPATAATAISGALAPRWHSRDHRRHSTHLDHQHPEQRRCRYLYRAREDPEAANPVFGQPTPGVLGKEQAASIAVPTGYAGNIQIV
ncbi:hypothetical protein B0H66DRAFT_530061 [Apodospora peruviana]|uniref:Uncharacterized protein n=1 Tax=Apodospora peruviana TaxID=516989 RepID=A0AAE0IJG9_9PEZI|nr:hypothetical protein B0H66DRAFT_530061 [Apodospora peruviana]